jgi:hypothetical protein
MVRHVREGRHRAQAERAVRLDPVRLLEAAQRDQDTRSELAALHVGIEVGAARHRHGVRAMIGEKARGVARRAGGGIAERGQPQHVAILMAAAPDPRPAPWPGRRGQGRDLDRLRVGDGRHLGTPVPLVERGRAPSPA